MNPEWQTRIRNELPGAEVQPDEIPHWGSISNLEILDVVVKETLRLHAAAPASLWREVPESGLLLGGYHIPQKVSRLASQVDSMFRLLFQCNVTPHIATLTHFLTRRNSIHTDGCGNSERLMP